MKRWLLRFLVLAGALLMAVGLRSAGIGWTVYDSLQRASPYRPVSELALIQLDDSTVTALAREQNLYFPYPRALYAEVLRVAKKLNAQAVLFDVIFSEPSVRGPEDDESFAKALREADFPVVFPSSAEGEIPPPLDMFRAPRIHLGNASFRPERDGIYRKVGTDPGKPLSFSETAFSAIHGGVPNFSGYVRYPKRSAIPEFPLYNILRLAAGEDDASTEEGLRGKIWIVGYTAAGLLDLKPSPVDSKTPGAWIHAAALNNLLTKNRGLFVPGIALLSLSALLLVLLFAGLLRVLAPATPMALVAWAVGGGIGLSTVATLAAWRAGVWLDPFAMGGALFVVGLAYVVSKIFLEWRERLRFAHLVAHSMSSDMVELIRSGQIEVGRFAERRPITVLFADLAGFTTLSERLPPEELVEIINGYLDGVVDLIFRHKGYVDKFIGDAVMALWGAPVRDDNSPEHALRAAIEFQALTESYRLKLVARGLDVPIYTRVGVHTGDAVVGNMGAQNRYNYTALGDTVNLASRLEGLGKHYGQLLLVSGEAYDRAGGELQARLLKVDEVVVKGKSETTRIYTQAESLGATERASFEQAFAAYGREDFSGAVQALRGLQAFGPAKILQARCDAFLQGSGSRNYRKGIWHHDEK